MVEDAGVPAAVIAILVPLHMVVTVGLSAGANGGLFTNIVLVAAHPLAV